MRRGILPVPLDRRAVSPVFAELLMVAMMLGMGTSVYLMVNGITDRPLTTPTLLSLSDRGQNHADAPGYCCLNDTLLEVVDASGEPRPWDPYLEFQIFDPTGDSLFLQGQLLPAPTDPSQYYDGVYHGAPGEPSIVNVAFVDLDHDTFISVFDHIEIRGMSEEYHDAFFKITTEGIVLATHVLP